MWQVGDNFEITNRGIQNTTVGKQYHIVTISKNNMGAQTEYAFLDDTGNLIYIVESIFNACASPVLPQPKYPNMLGGLVPPSTGIGAGLLGIQAFDDDDDYTGGFDLVEAFEYFKKKRSRRCSCGSASAGSPGHANHCDIITGRNSFS